MKLKIEVNQEEEFELEARDHETLLNGVSTDYSIARIGDSEFLMHRNKKAYTIILQEKKGGQLKAVINGQEVALHVKDHIAQILEQLGMDTAIENEINQINAPMPGAILDVMVKEGDEINEGDTLLILEAMKMENAIKSPITGKVDTIHIRKGENVEKNQTLISF